MSRLGEMASSLTNDSADHRPAESALARAIWVLGGLWVAVQVQRQIMPALLGASPILRDFGITADDAGLLAAIYFPVYGLMQIPSGLIADLGGLRRLLIWSCLVLGIAGVAFALAPSLAWAIAARALIGIASSLFWVPSLKLCLQLSPRLYGRSVGLMVAAGSVGGVVALLAFPLVLQQLPWRTAALLSAAAMFPFAAVMLLLPDPPPSAAIGARRGLDPRALLEALRDARFWLLTWPAMMWEGTWFGLLTWLPRYARDALGVAPAATGLLPAAATAALIPGSYLFGWATSRQPRLGWPLFFLAQVVSLLAAAALPLLGEHPGQLALYLIVLVLGALFGAFFLYVPLLAAENPTSRVGAATGLANCLAFLPAFVAPWLMGQALDVVDRPTAPDPIYSPTAYAAAWLVAAAFLAAGLLGTAPLSLWSRRAPR